MENTQIQLAVDVEGERLDRFLASQLADASRAEIQRWIREERVTVDGRSAKSSYRVSVGQIVQLCRPPAGPQPVLAEQFELEIRYEDDDLLVVDKPTGMVVHPAPGHTSGTLVNGLLGRYPDLAEVGGAARAGIVHRLDRDTSGLLVVAKTGPAYSVLQAQFKARMVRKTYTALVEGLVDVQEGRIEAAVGRDPRHRKRMAVLAKRRGGRQAITLFRLAEHLQPPVNPQRLAFSLLEIEPLTGRTHQIRVHMAHIRHPVVGDRIYGRRYQPISCPRQFLHAARLGFKQPVSGAPIEVKAPLPADLRAVLDGLVKVR